MEVNENSIDKEIGNMLAEAPLVPEPKKEIKIKKKLNKKPIIYASLAIIIIIVGLMILPSCEPPTCENQNCTLEVAKINQDFVDSIKHQIISRGYAEINDGGNIFKLAPYIG